MTLQLPPLCMLSVDFIPGLCVALELYRFILKIFQTHIPYNRWDKKQEKQDFMHWFWSIYTALIKTFSVSRVFLMIIRSGSFSLFLLRFFCLHFVLLAESKPLICKFNHSTVHARVAVIFFFFNIREILWFEKSL